MKQSELLRKQADMMDMAENYGVDDWRELVRFWHDDRWVPLVGNSLTMHTTWSYSLALGVVEGKPVFEGDKLWFEGESTPTTAYEGHNLASGAWSWTPPKPKTVTVELLRSDAEYFANEPRWGRAIAGYQRVFAACRKALEEQK